MAWKSLTGFDASGQKIVNVADPSNPSDVVNLQFLQNFIAGMDVKESVRTASTANVTLASPGASIGGVALADGDRVLLKDQTDASENGIYVFDTAATPLVRATDADSNADVTAGLFVPMVEEGTHADTSWILTTNNPIVLDTTNLSFSQYAAGGTAYTADGNGIELSGTEFQLELATNSALSKSSAGLTVASSIAGDALSWTNGVLAVAAGSGLEINTDTLRIAAAAAGDGLTGGAGSALAVGAGTGITVNADNVAVDTSVVVTTPSTVVRKYSTDVPAGSTTAPITHGLATKDITWSLRVNADDSFVVADGVATDTNTLTLTFATAPTSGQYRVTVHG